MKIYLASTFRLANRVRDVCAALEESGHEIPDKWWGQNADRSDDSVTDAQWHSKSEIRALEVRHWRTIHAADCLVLVGGALFDEARTSFTGANVEVGYALGIGKPVVILGRVKRSAMYSGCIFVQDLYELETTLEIIRGADRS